MEKPKIVTIVGPTATGKSSLAIYLAQKFKGEIINADSMQVYRGLDIGTAKPSQEEQGRVHHHLIDILNPDEPYSAAIFRKQADEIIQMLHKKKIPIFVVGGTGLYMKVLTRGIFHGPEADPELRRRLKKRIAEEGSKALHEELRILDPEAASRIHPRDSIRIVRALEVAYQTKRPLSSWQREHGFQEKPYEVLKIGLICEKDELKKRIEERVEEMLKKGWVEEVKNLLARGYTPNLKPFQALGYKQIISYLHGQIDFRAAVDLIKKETRKYAKRQITWFKADPEINWYSASLENWPHIEKRVEPFLSDCVVIGGW